MSDPTGFTPRERYMTEMWRAPRTLFRNSLLRLLAFVVPSLILFAYAIVNRDVTAGVIAYALLLAEETQRLVVLRSGLASQSQIVAKLEARAERRQIASDAAPPPPAAEA